MKKACLIQTVRIFYSSVIKPVHILQGVTWNVQQNVHYDTAASI